jgi:hypothetical protein
MGSSTIIEPLPPKKGKWAKTVGKYSFEALV